MRPAAMTTMRSARRTVERRWAMTKAASFHDALDGGLDRPFPLGVEGARGLIQNQNGRVVVQRTG